MPAGYKQGDSRLAPVCGRKSDSQPVGNTNCHPNTGTLSVSTDQSLVKALRRKVAYHLRKQY
ncbi:MAG: hypothetical protein LBC02_10080 [Planctomycetaceae bacterium]|nr:hypothetical protein [Planctomycetaceae bacterium]